MINVHCFKANKCFLAILTNCNDTNISDNRSHKSNVTNELQTNTNSIVNSQPIQQPQTVPLQTNIETVQEPNNCNVTIYIYIHFIIIKFF